MLKVLAPIAEKSLSIFERRASMDVSMPTKAVMPTAMIKAVSVVLNIWLRIDRKAINTFSHWIFLTAAGLMIRAIKIRNPFPDLLTAHHNSYFRGSKSADRRRFSARKARLDPYVVVSDGFLIFPNRG